MTIKAGKEWHVLFMLQFARAMPFLDLAIIAIALPTLVAAFHLTPSQGIWVITMYHLTSSITFLLCGPLGAWPGERYVISLGCVIFGIGCFICALSPTLAVLLMGRALMGIGGGLIQPLGSAVLNMAFRTGSPQFATGRTLFLIMEALSPMISGLVVHYIGWRAIFWINIPIAMFCFLGGVLWMERGSVHRIQYPYLSAFYSVLGGSLFILGLSWGNLYGWKDPVVLSALGIGMLMIWLCIRHSARDTHPLIPLSLFKSRTFSLTIWHIFFFSMAASLMTFWIVYIGHTASHVALILGTLIFICQLPAVLVGYCSARALAIFKTRTVILVLYVVLLLGTFCVGLFTPLVSMWIFFGGLTLFATARSNIAAFSIQWALEFMPAEQSYSPSSVIAAIQRYGQTVGLIILTSLFQTLSAWTPHAFFIANFTGLTWAIIGFLFVLFVGKRCQHSG